MSIFSILKDITKPEAKPFALQTLTPKQADWLAHKTERRAKERAGRASRAIPIDYSPILRRAPAGNVVAVPTTMTIDGAPVGCLFASISEHRRRQALAGRKVRNRRPGSPRGNARRAARVSANEACALQQLLERRLREHRGLSWRAVEKEGWRWRSLNDIASFYGVSLAPDYDHPLNPAQEAA